jgi:hypothetical protein
MREFNLTLSLQSNLHYTLLVASNKFFYGVLGIDIGGYARQVDLTLTSNEHIYLNRRRYRCQQQEAQ